MHYSHVEYYIKFMIQRCIKIGLVLANQMRYNMKNENLQIVYLDEEVNRNKY